MVIITDTFFEKKQVKVRTLQNKKMSEKVISRSELVDYLQPKQGLDKPESTDVLTNAKSSTLLGPENPSAVMPVVNITVLDQGNKPIHLRRRSRDQVRTCVCIYAIMHMQNADHWPITDQFSKIVYQIFHHAWVIIHLVRYIMADQLHREME